MIKLLHVVGARPNFMKIAPVMREVARHPGEFCQVLVHTGQHYDTNMSQIFFDELELPVPDVNLGVGSGSHARQTAEVMVQFEPVLQAQKPDWVLVPGDVNSTLACALVASKLGVRVAHVEAGLRSFDRTMPEETNRLLTDHLADLLLTPSRDADENLRREGIAPDRIRLVGNVMIDTLVALLPKAERLWPALREALALEGPYVLVTLHRPSNVDDPTTFQQMVSALNVTARDITVVFPVHPRTRKLLDSVMPAGVNDRLILLEPLGYLEFLALQAHARLVMTDSGGVQEETTYLGVPCLTARPNTERPITITYGTNRLVKSTYPELVAGIRSALASTTEARHAPRRPDLWDGAAAQRIVTALQEASS